MSDETNLVVQMQGLQLWFGRNQVLADVDLRVEEGSVLALLGRNGSGKSTLMRMLAGLLPRDGGTLEVFGRDPERATASERARVALVTGDTSAASPGRRVGSELRLVRGLRRHRWDDARAAELMERFEVDPTRRIGALSKGEDARMRLVLALAGQPDLLLLDEPALGLDLFARRDLLEAIIETVEGTRHTVILASHMLDDVERVADAYAFLDRGRVVVRGGVDELRDRFRRVRVALGAGGEEALARAAAEVGCRLEREAEGPTAERLAHFREFTAERLARLVEVSGARVLETRRMDVREIAFEALGRQDAATAAAVAEVVS